MSRKNRVTLILTFLILIFLYPTCVKLNNVSLIQIHSLRLLISTNTLITQNYLIHDPISITNDNELATFANSGIGTRNNPYIIANWNITSSKINGIYITGTTKYFIIKNCLIVNSHICGIYVDDITPGTATITNNICIKNSGDGIYFEGSGSSIIANNICINNDKSGIYIWLSSSSTVINNTCTNNHGIGFYLGGSGFSTIANNTCSNNGEDGIYLSYSDLLTVVNNTCNSNNGDGISLSFAINSIITVNTCTNNREKGIYLWDSDFSAIDNNICINNTDGITLGFSHYSTGTNNFCNKNSDDGISLFRSSYSSLFWNTLIENGVYGVELYEGSNNNTIHHNSFIINGQNNSQGCDNGMNNKWYDKTLLEGNSWSDYSGIGGYFIAGLAKTSDPYPLLIGTTDTHNFFFFISRVGLFLFILGVLLILFINNKYKKIK